jgi:hypothetical protein
MHRAVLEVRALAPACLNIDALAAEMRICKGANERYAAGMKHRQPDVYTDTMLWIMDGRRSWNRRRGKKGKRRTGRTRSRVDCRRSL